MELGELGWIRKVYQYKIFLVLAVGILTICMGSWLLVFQNGGKEARGGQGYKSYTSIEIQSGDSLWSIASEYMTEEYGSVQEYMKEIKSLNGLRSDEIHAGKFLVVPYYIRQ